MATAVIGAGPAGSLFAFVARVLAERRGCVFPIFLFDKRSHYARTHRLRLDPEPHLAIGRAVEHPGYDDLLAFLASEGFSPAVNVLEERLSKLVSALGIERELSTMGGGPGEVSIAGLRERLEGEGRLAPHARLTIVAADSVHSATRELVRGNQLPRAQVHQTVVRLRLEARNLRAKSAPPAPRPETRGPRPEPRPAPTVPPPVRPVAPPAPATPEPQGPSIVRPIYETKDEAFEGALNEALAESLHAADQHGRHVEYSGAVFRIDQGEHAGKYSYTPAVKGGFKHAPVVTAPEGTERVALHHSHPQEGENVEFSLPDVVEAFLAGVPIIVVGKPTEAPPIMKQYDPPKELPVGISIDPITNRVTVENVPDHVAPEAHALKRFLSAGTERVLR